MKREIIFRVYIKLNEQGKEFYNKEEALFIESKIHEVVSICLKYNNLTILEQDEKSVLTIFKDYCDVYELMQFTGLTDKNGVKIFEGDKLTDGIVVYVVEYNTQNTSFAIKPIERLKTKEYDFLDCIKYDQLGNGYYSRKDLEIIGNIHE